MASAKKEKIAIFVSFSGHGGVERMISNLARGIAAQGYPVDLVLIKSNSPHLEHLPETVNLVRLGTRHTFASLFPLIKYLRREKPTVMLAVKDRALKVAVMAKKFSGYPTTLSARLGTTVSAALEGKSRLRRAMWFGSMRLFYPHVDEIIAVSQGVADDISRITRIPANDINVICNPVITPDIHEKAKADPEHPWLTNKTAPVIIGVGRLTRQKDFHTLVRAFAKVKEQQDSRLILLGDGGDKASLIQLAEELGVRKAIDFAGFVSNPYSYVSRADLFVLSSRWEGSPNVLTEALALGIPVVSTDCPSGPKEVLQNGQYGPLVEMGDDATLAKKIRSTLANPLDSATLKQAVEYYTMEESSRRYLKTMRA